MKYFNGTGSPVASLDLSKRRDESERMYSQILGERIDIVFATELNLEHRPSLLGFASAGVHTLVAESLPNRYVEARPGIVVMDADLRAMEPATAATLFDGIALHEVAHLVEVKITTAVCPNFHGREHRAMSVAPAEVESVKWLTHDF